MLKRMAAMQPGIQPAQVRMNVRSTAPQPLSNTASGGNKMQRIALTQPMVVLLEKGIVFAQYRYFKNGSQEKMFEK